MSGNKKKIFLNTTTLLSALCLFIFNLITFPVIVRILGIEIGDRKNEITISVLKKK